MFEFAKEMYFDESALGNESLRDSSLLRILRSTAITAGSLKESKTRFSLSNTKDFLDRLKVFLQEK